jgi:hypothetical protein
VQLDEQPGPTQLEIFISLNNDGSNNFDVSMHVKEGSTFLFLYTTRTYADAFDAIEDAATYTAGFFRDGWTCK